MGKEGRKVEESPPLLGSSVAQGLKGNFAAPKKWKVEVIRHRRREKSWEGG